MYRKIKGCEQTIHKKREFTNYCEICEKKNPILDNTFY